jgi:predicted DNA-binding antitoxin AbrB/MazE fold protein
MNTSLLDRQREEVDKRREAMDNAIVSLEVGNMATERVVIPGIVKNGVVVPQNDIPLPDGAHVDILISQADVTPALKSELEQWDKASDEAWAMIDQWEAEER